MAPWRSKGAPTQIGSDHLPFSVQLTCQGRTNGENRRLTARACAKMRAQRTGENLNGGTVSAHLSSRPPLGQSQQAKENVMKNQTLSTLCAVALLAGVSGAVAQPAATTTTTTTIVTTEDRGKIVGFVKKQKPKVVTIKEPVKVGVTLPKTVELQTFPADVGVTKYRYVYLDNRIALVEPDSYRVVEVIDVK